MRLGASKYGSMRLVACRLRLAAYVASGAQHNILESTRSLVERIRDVGDVMIPAASTAAAFIALVPGWAGVACLYHGRRVGPALDWSLVDHMRGHTND